MKGDTRIRAARVILKWIEEGAFPDRQLAGETRDRAFLMEVAYGAVKWVRRLDWFLVRLANRKPEPAIRAHLLAALYQVFHMDTVEPYALVDETVEAVKREKGRPEAGFVNAVLRRALRERETLVAAIRTAPLAVRESHPDLLVKRWTARWGEERTTALLAWNNSRPTVTVRIQTSRISPDEVRARWNEAGVPFEPHPAFPDRCLTLGKGVEVTALPGWADGWVAVQDASTLPAVNLLDPRPGMRILDACAAPGGKLGDIIDRAGASGVVALDASSARMAHVRENLARLGGAGVTVRVGDLLKPETGRALLKGGAFDRILLDAPCSNTGVLRRRADARWRFTAESPVQMAAAQGALLEAAVSLLKPGGRLVYSTCSIEPEECGDRVRSWLKAHPGWSCLDEVLWLPGEHAADGAYAALLARGAL